MRRALIVWFCLSAALASSAGARARCVAIRRGDRVLLEVRLEGMFDRELLRLVRLGLAGQVRLGATLYRRRAYWFDDERATRAIGAVVTYHPPGRWLLDGVREIDPAVIDLATLSLGVGEIGGGAHYVTLTARLDVVTIASLGQAASWLTRGGGPNLSSRALMGLVVRDLARTMETSCEVVDVAPLP